MKIKFGKKNQNLREQLIATADKKLMYKNGGEENLLGKMLERLRSKINKEEEWVVVHNIQSDLSKRHTI